MGNDQLTAILRLCRADPALASINPAPYDGDTPTEARRTIRATSRYLVTNPDMLHGGILAYPDLWRRLLANLRYVIVDEAHQYRGVLGRMFPWCFGGCSGSPGAHSSHGAI